jgi:leucyl-tRNA---protein transferase
MRTFRSEYLFNYATYSYGYSSYCLPESASELPLVYASGYLPYSGDPPLSADVFYLARSLRVRLDSFSDTSENRRIDRKIAPLGVAPVLHTLADVDTERPALVSFCERYAADRFTAGAMTPERIRRILDGGLVTHVIEFRSAEKTYGYVFAVLGAGFLHYWFSFFETTYLRSHSLGKWLMWRSIHLAGELGLTHVYLGTCYGARGLYKARDHRGVEFFDGTDWCVDLETLKDLARRDDARGPAAQDLYKERGNARFDALFARHLRAAATRVL